MNKEAKTVLLTGGTGFVGSHLLDRLVTQYKVILLKRSFSDTKYISHLLGSNLVKVFDVDRVSVKDVFKAIDGAVDIVAHVATSYGRKGESASQIVQSTMILPLELMECAIQHGTKTFINTSSFFNKSIGLQDVLGIHAKSKELATLFVEKIARQSGMQLLNLEMPHVYGPRDDSRKLVPAIIMKLLNNEETIPLVRGNNERVFIYINDLINIYMTLLENAHRMEQIETFYGRTGEVSTVKEMVELAKKLIGNTKTHLNFGAYPERPEELMKIPDPVERKLNKYGRGAEYNLERGLLETIEWYKTNMQINR